MQLFFARALRSVSEEEVKALFAQFGQVFDVVLFRAFQGAPTSRVSRRAGVLDRWCCNQAISMAVGQYHSWHCVSGDSHIMTSMAGPCMLFCVWAVR
jgi:hypothetical protein